MDLSEVKVLELDEVALHILRTAQLIEERGHCKGLYRDRGRYCVLGAFGAAGQGSLEASRRLWEALGDIPRWNDAPERTPEEVISTLRRIAFETNGQL